MITIDLSTFDAEMLYRIFSEFKDSIDIVNEYVSVSFALGFICDKLEGAGVQLEQ